ncbi:FCD domain-containing protein [Castellaniella sp. GW247-6E4]|uniref:GntR family transcriptional regulator n=1 Tax=Castellaniella sp. GW247-6E4 TaxID=3140380 RepID=UPI003314A65C
MGLETAEPRTTASMLAATIQSDIINGSLYPNAHLRIKDLCVRYRSGPIPIREALSRLISSGFVIAKAQKGFFVAGVSLSELVDITETRIYVECEALRRSIKSGNLGWEEKLVSIHHRLNKTPIYAEGGSGFTNEWEQIHSHFHEVLISGCDSESLLDVSKTLRNRTARYRQLSASSKAISEASEANTKSNRYETERDVTGEHLRIVEATLEHDSKRATHLLAEHYRRTVQLVLRWTQTS